MAKVDTLPVNVWDATFAASDTLAVTRFQISAQAHDTLNAWSREKTGRSESQPISVVMRGLSEITAWFAPEVAFVRQDFDTALRPTAQLLFRRRGQG